ncbi:MAG TPA: DUF2752 domain-containing protein [bacterium]|nr:DUF2752 domain-containing protein [bacterium]
MARPPKNRWTIPVADGPVGVVADRITAAAVGGVAVFLSVALIGADPDARGHGTHEQFGMDPCGWPLVYGIPCPTCGCTTAATQVVHGDLVGAFVTQPFGAVFALLGMLAGAHAILCLVRGRSFVDVLVRVPFWKIVFWMFVLLLASWGYKYLVWEG